jgi:hypothetical protein
MSTATLQTTYSYQPSAVKRFFNWTIEQQKNSLLWVGVGLAGHGCVITPLTLYAVFSFGLNLPLFMMALAAMAMTLIVNLAALPTKITIPVFLFSILIDVAAIVAAVALAAGQ